MRAPTGGRAGPPQPAEVLQPHPVAGLEVAAGNRRGREPGQVQRGGLVLVDGGGVAPGLDPGADLVARVDHEHHRRVGGGERAPDVELGDGAGLSGPGRSLAVEPGGDPPVDPPQPVARPERGDVVQVAAVARAPGPVRARQPLQPEGQRQRPQRAGRGQHRHHHRRLRADRAQQQPGRVGRAGVQLEQRPAARPDRAHPHRDDGAVAGQQQRLARPVPGSAHPDAEERDAPRGLLDELGLQPARGRRLVGGPEPRAGLGARPPGPRDDEAEQQRQAERGDLGAARDQPDDGHQDPADQPRRAGRRGDQPRRRGRVGPSRERGIGVDHPGARVRRRAGHVGARPGVTARSPSRPGPARWRAGSRRRRRRRARWPTSGG